MNNPKFTVGQDVGVCCLPRFSLVIPKTKVIEILSLEKGDLVQLPDRRGRANRSGNFYLVVDHDKFLNEEWIRPYSEGDYNEDTQDIQSPIERGVSA